MNRFEELRRFVDRSSLGLEVAPYFRPIAAKADGYNVLTLDVFDTSTLRQMAADDPSISDEQAKRIESVDFVSDASRLKALVQEHNLVGKANYILSSHNFEHLPDPISFLQGCSDALSPGGVLSMAIPDYRACFDHFRMPTRLSDWLAAYHRGYTRPSPETLFDSGANLAAYMQGGVPTVGLGVGSRCNPELFRTSQDLRSQYARYTAELQEPSSYQDAHCTVVFGEVFELLVRDLRHLGLVDLEIVDISRTIGLEFFVHLRKPIDPSDIGESDEDFRARRLELLRKIDLSLGSPGLLKATRFSQDILLVSLTASAKRAARGIVGDRRFQKLKDMNALRRARRRSGSD